jgi:single-strand DNA-binding protein
MHKGSKAALVGRVENDNYTNKNGEKVYSVKVLVDEIEFAERKQQDGGNANPTTNDDDDFVQVDMNAVGDLPFFAKEKN